MPILLLAVYAAVAKKGLPKIFVSYSLHSIIEYKLLFIKMIMQNIGRLRLIAILICRYKLKRGSVDGDKGEDTLGKRRHSRQASA